MPWRELYWKVWAHTLEFPCSSCEEWFVGAELEHCNYHPQAATYISFINVGEFPCCKKKIKRFDVSVGKEIGCTSKAHEVAETDVQNREEYDLLIAKKDICLTPFGKTSSIQIVSLLNEYLSKEDDAESEGEGEEEEPEVNQSESDGEASEEENTTEAETPVEHNLVARDIPSTPVPAPKKKKKRAKMSPSRRRLK